MAAGGKGPPARSCAPRSLHAIKKEFDIPDYDAEILTGSKHLADLFEETTELCGKPKKVSNWLMGETLRLLKEAGQEPRGDHFLGRTSGKADRAARRRHDQPDRRQGGLRADLP